MCYIQWGSPWMDTWHENIEHCGNLAHKMWSWAPAHLFICLDKSLLFSFHISKKSLANDNCRGPNCFLMNKNIPGDWGVFLYFFGRSLIFLSAAWEPFSAIQRGPMTKGITWSWHSLCVLSCRTADWLIGLYSFWDGHPLTLKSSGMRSLDVLRKLRM